VQVFREEDVVALLDTLNLLESQHVVNGSTQLYYGDLTNIYGSVREVTPGAPAWSLILPIYGPEKVIRAQLEYARDKFARVPGMRFAEGELLRTPLSAEALQRVRQVNFGVPNLAIFSMLGRSAANPAPAGGHIGFSPVIPRTDESVWSTSSTTVRTWRRWRTARISASSVRYS